MRSRARAAWIWSSAHEARWPQRARTAFIGAVAFAAACAAPKPAPLPPRPAPPPPVVVVEPPAPSGPEHQSIAPIDKHAATLLDSGELIVRHRGGLKA